MAHIKQFQHLKIQLETIKSATNNFSDDNCIGRGGFGKVYKGELDGQKMVAVKRLDRSFGQGKTEFWKEIMMLSLYRHENIVSLIGYSDDCREKILVYEYASMKSLDLYLNNDDLTWVLRLQICIGAARGLEYLHTPVETQLRLLHRDIKSSNILLDGNWNAMISDFGLSKFVPANKQFTYILSNCVGTVGYCDPVYVESGLLTKESDVYSLGVVLFEVLCGRLSMGCNDDKRRPLVGLVRERYEENRLDEIICDNIKKEIHPDSLKVFVQIAYQCLKIKREERPSITEIVAALEKALEYQCSEPPIPPNPPNPPKPLSAGILKVKVLRGKNLKRKGFRDSFNPYVVLKLTESSLPCVKKTTVKHNNVEPEWNEELTLCVENFDVQSLEIWVGNAVSVDRHDILRMALMSLTDLTPETPKARDFYIFNPRYNNRVVGMLKVEAVYVPITNDQISIENGVLHVLQKAPLGTPVGGGLLVVIIHEGRFGRENISVYFLFQGESRKMPVCL
uniref:probable serine/threonine-protein kinase PBL1 n=1 Tax=Erigeron canadensis TaxID=72917 RepID=UPI001CB9C6EB|nr:probable serine/threonine-protein kinase PBL1 [Erigeron canadensis]